MGIRLLGAALATAWFLSVPAAALAQRHDGGHREGAKNGGEHAAGGNGETHTRSGGATTQVRTGAPHIVTAGPYGMFFTEPHSASGMFFTQPYYAFRPREHVGFGLYLGYPVPFPSARFYSNAYSYPYGYYPYRW